MAVNMFFVREFIFNLSQAADKHQLLHLSLLRDLLRIRREVCPFVMLPEKYLSLFLLHLKLCFCSQQKKERQHIDLLCQILGQEASQALRCERQRRKTLSPRLEIGWQPS